MSRRFILVAIAVALPGVALAQDDEVKSSSMIGCELDGGCAQDADTPPPAEAPAGEAATRSWSWGNRSTAPTTSVAPAAVRPAARPVALAGSGRAPLSKTYGNATSRLAISFASGSDQLTPAGRRQADELFRAIATRARAGGRYLIAGHTDASGPRELNLDLSRRRAQVLVDYLVEKGIARDNFRARGYGADRPLTGLAAGASANRRVEVTKLN